jgi:hypothetical protein
MSIPAYLYSVSPPGSGMTSSPSMFWHTEDWESSGDRRDEGYLVDSVLFVDDFEEVSIDLFALLRDVRIHRIDTGAEHLCKLGLTCSPNKIAYIFVNHSCMSEVKAFCPSIFTPTPIGFTRVR